jgi:choline-sulfatase
MRDLWMAVALLMTMAGFARAEPQRPNILWICADDHAPYVCGAYGNRIIRTPNLDRLATEGVRFDSAYCNSPVCTASRQSFLTGRYPRTIGVTLLGTPLPADEPTLATLLRAAGYDTAAIGKMHFNSNLMHGFDVRIDVPQHAHHLKEHPPKPLPPDIEVQPPWRPFRDPARIWLNSACLPFGARDGEMAGTFFARHAARYLRERRDKPFFLMVSFYEPHSPFHFPIEYRGKYRPEQFAVPKVGPEDDAQIPAIFRALTEHDKQGIIAAYYTSTEFMDKNAGLVLDALKRSGHAADTPGDLHGRSRLCARPARPLREALLLRASGALVAASALAATLQSRTKHESARRVHRHRADRARLLPRPGAGHGARQESGSAVAWRSQEAPQSGRGRICGERGGVNPHGALEIHLQHGQAATARRLRHRQAAARTDDSSLRRGERSR